MKKRIQVQYFPGLMQRLFDHGWLWRLCTFSCHKRKFRVLLRRRDQFLHVLGKANEASLKDTLQLFQS